VAGGARGGRPGWGVATVRGWWLGLAGLKPAPGNLVGELMLTGARGPNLVVMNGPGHPDFGAAMHRALELARLLDARDEGRGAEE